MVLEYIAEKNGSRHPAKWPLAGCDHVLQEKDLCSCLNPLVEENRAEIMDVVFYFRLVFFLAVNIAFSTKWALIVADISS